MLSEKKLDFWIKENLNVLMIGRHGVGKTSIIKAAFERNKLKWKYFSAATMDPWVDFVGIPKEQKDSNNSPYLDFVRPKDFRDDAIEALFFDEYNRAPKKVKNAVMELIQFKSINGYKFKNLRMVWAAINPDDDVDADYDVEKLDPAQRDRFQIHVTLPFAPDKGYFTRQFGDQITECILAWWKELSPPQQFLVSPRRLDYALQIWQAQGDIRDVLPSNVGILNLLQRLQGGFDCKAQMNQILKSNSQEAAKAFINAHLNQIVPIVASNLSKFGSFFLPLMPEEVTRKMASENYKVRRILSSNLFVYKCITCGKGYFSGGPFRKHVRICAEKKIT